MINARSSLNRLRSAPAKSLGVLLTTGLLLAGCGGSEGPSAPATFTVGGTVSGLSGTVVLNLNGAGGLSVSANGSFQFASALASGVGYSVTVATQPTGQTCSVTGGSGTMGASNVTSVSVTCTTNTYTIGGTVTGLSGTVGLQQNGADDLSINADGSFQFATPVSFGAGYAVTVGTQPVGQTCSVTNGSGTVGAANVTNVSVTCTTNTYTIGGTVTGLKGLGCTLQLNGGSDLVIPASGSFTFSTPLLYGEAYDVTVATQPTGPDQTCVIASGSGTVGAANVTDVGVACTLIQPACLNATNLGTMSGDVGAGQTTRTGTGEAWFKLHLQEDNTGVDYLSARFVLTVPSGVDYDLYVYCGGCGGAEAGSSTNPSGITEVVTVRWEDNFGGDDSNDVFVHVVYWSGSSVVPWTLDVDANVTATTTTCSF